MNHDQIYLTGYMFFNLSPPHDACQLIDWGWSENAYYWLLHKSKYWKVKDRPFAEGRMDLERCQSSKLKSEINIILGGAPFLSTLRPRVINIFHVKHISGGSQVVKVNVYSPSTKKHTPRLAESTGTVHTNNIPGGVLFNYLHFFLISGLGIPITAPLVQGWVNKHSSWE